MTRPADRPRRAVLVARQRVGVGDVSRTGCRVESSQPLAVGAVGILAVQIGGEPHFDVFRVCRSRAIPGSTSVYEVGMEFLPMPAETASLHDIAAELDQADAT